MELIDNINTLLGESLKGTIKPGSKLKIAASCFSIYAYVALKKELESIDSLEFIFTSPTFVPNEVSDKIKKEQREFYIPKAERERSLTGSEFEIQLKNQLTQKAIAKECADWIRRKATFRSNLCPFRDLQLSISATRKVARSRTSFPVSMNRPTLACSSTCSSRFGSIRKSLKM